MTNRTIATTAVRAGYAALTTIALFSAAPALSQEPRQERVSYNDLDLTGEPGQAALSKRIEAAVKRVCSPVGSSAADALEWRRCKQASRAGAYQQMKVAIAKAGGARTGIAALTLGGPTTGKH